MTIVYQYSLKQWYCIKWVAYKCSLQKGNQNFHRSISNYRSIIIFNMRIAISGFRLKPEALFNNSFCKDFGGRSYDCPPAQTGFSPFAFLAFLLIRQVSFLSLSLSLLFLLLSLYLSLSFSFSIFLSFTLSFRVFPSPLSSLSPSLYLFLSLVSRLLCPSLSLLIVYLVLVLKNHSQS